MPPRVALVIAISEYDSLRPLRGASVDAVRACHCCQQLGFSITPIVGRVTMSQLDSGVGSFFQALEAVCVESSSPVALIIVSCHGLHCGSDECPQIITSEASTQSMDTFNVQEKIVRRLNGIRPQDRFGMSAVFIFDCCRENDSSENDNNVTWRSSSIMPSLRKDFYFLFSCDPGRRASERPEGGVIVHAVTMLLPYAVPIMKVLEEAARSVVVGPAASTRQRPWVNSRVGQEPLILGHVPGPLPQVLPAVGSSGTRGSVQPPVVNVVLVGGTGHGKTTLGNALCGRNAFLVSNDFESATEQAEGANFFESECCFRVVDTVGFLDTRLSPLEHADKFAEFADSVPDGVDAFLIVIRSGRFTQTDVDLFQSFCEAAGESAMQHAIVVFTFAKLSQLWGAECPLQVCRGSKNALLKGVAERVRQVIAVDLDGDDACNAARSKICKDILWLVGCNKATRYTNSTLQSAKQRRAELLDILQQLQGNRKELFELRAKAVLSGHASCLDVLQEARSALASQKEELKAEERKAEEAAAKPVELQREQAKERFCKRRITEDANGRLHKFKWVWDGTAKDEQTGFQVVSKHWKSQNGAKEHAREELFEAMWRNNLLS
eukprot:TRINITY_DN57288_c0_g1_i1.p1 TRINITY_DN57288_c0_g1~~TRINITY_DN57288_c0_g1_i1.p1  ORF type:complete len:627 (-),score=112.61 TRINITY_DN57288_c0_g1_i1:89-1912(-)